MMKETFRASEKSLHLKVSFTFPENFFHISQSIRWIDKSQKNALDLANQSKRERKDEVGIKLLR
jgi:hypothetical protein